MCIDFKRLARPALKGVFSGLFPALCLALPSVVEAGGSLDSTTILNVQQSSLPGFQSKTLMPAIEFFGLDMDKLGDGNLSVHFYGWGQLDLADRQPSIYGEQDRVDGSLTYGYLQYRFKYANAQAKAGRLFVNEGIINEQVDGAYAHTDLPYGFGVSAFGGATVHTVDVPNLGTDGKGNGIYGGRAFYRSGGLAEVGFSGVYESTAPAMAAANAIPGAFGNHRIVGPDVWLRPVSMLQLSGHTTINAETGGVAEHSYLAQLTPLKDLTVSASYEEYHDRDFFYSSIIFADMLKNLSQDSRIIGGSATYKLPYSLELSGDYKHYQRDIGQAERFGGELRGNFQDNTVRSGLSYHYLRASNAFAVVPVDSASGSYHEARGFLMRDTKTFVTSLDLIGYFFKEPVENKSQAWQLAGSLGYHLTPELALSGDLSYGQNPQYNDELRGLIRLTYNTNFGKGDKK